MQRASKNIGRNRDKQNCPDFICVENVAKATLLKNEIKQDSARNAEHG